MNDETTKKRILFVMNCLRCGGVEKSFISVLSLFPQEKFDITIEIIEKAGSLLLEVPSWIKIHELPLQFMDRYEFQHGNSAALRYGITHFHWLYVCRTFVERLFWLACRRNSDYNLMRLRHMVHRVKVDIPIEYDFLFSYGGMYYASTVALELFKAPVTAAWFHLETQNQREGHEFYDRLYRHFDYRFCCSQKLADQLNAFYTPQGKAFTNFTYYLNPSLYEQLASAGKGFDDDFSGLRILTVGRLEYQKGYDVAIKVLARLKQAGYKVRWYAIGWGGCEAEYRKQIASLGLEKDFVLLGLQNNPYPYFKQCDIYAQPSRFEGYCLTVAEARVFNRPIVCTDFAGASEQIHSGENGLIVPEMTVEAFEMGVRILLDNEVLRSQFSDTLSRESADTETRVRAAWMNLLGE